MKHIFILLASWFGLLLLTTSCNDEWKDEQYTQYISFRAPLNDNGVTSCYVPYTRHNTDGTTKFGEGQSEFDQPVVVSGSTDNTKDITVHVAHDTDTLGILNYARFQNRSELYYVDMYDFATCPETLQIGAGTDVGLYNIKFNFKGIDMVNKYVLPLRIQDDNSYGYTSHPRKNYAKAMLRVYPFNDFSGDYSATTLTLGNSADTNNSPTGLSTVRAYVVDENTVFFYAGNIDESRVDRANYKIYARFSGGTQGSVTLWSENDKINFKTDGRCTYRVYELADEVKPYLLHRYVILNNINYSYVDYTSVKNYQISYTASGTMTLERQLNTQISDPDWQIVYSE